MIGSRSKRDSVHDFDFEKFDLNDSSLRFMVE